MAGRESRCYGSEYSASKTKQALSRYKALTGRRDYAYARVCQHADRRRNARLRLRVVFRTVKIVAGGLVEVDGYC